MAPPLHLESFNRIVYDLLIGRIKEKDANAKQASLESNIADFEQAMWHIFTPDPNTIIVSLNLGCYGQLQQYGAQNFIKNIYGPLLVAPEQGFNVTLRLLTNSPPPNGMTVEQMCMKVAQLHRNLIASPIAIACDAVSNRRQLNIMQVDYRPSESMWVRTNGDRVAVIFSINFTDPDDIVFGRVFLQEFGKNLSGAPAVDIKLRDPPRELQGMRLKPVEGYVTFMLENRHFSPQQRDKTFNMLVQFRDYLHYHLKCSKAYLHIRMRARVALLLQVLNRAKQELPKEKKTASGRTFVRR